MRMGSVLKLFFGLMSVIVTCYVQVANAAIPMQIHYTLVVDGPPPPPQIW